VKNKAEENLSIKLFGINLYDKTPAELIEIALELDCGIYDYLPAAWRNPGISGLCAFRLIADRLLLDLSKCTPEVRVFIKAIEDVTDKAIERFSNEGSQAYLKPLVNDLFQYSEGFKRITYAPEKAGPFIGAVANLPKMGQLVYRVADARFFVLVDNGYIEGPNGVVKMGDLPRAAIEHAHITVNEGMKKEEGQKWFGILKERFGETANPIYHSLAKPSEVEGLYYLNRVIKIDGIVGVYEGIPKTNCRIVKTCHLQVQSQDLIDLAQEGLGPQLVDYTYHITFCEMMRGPYPGLKAINVGNELFTITDLLSPFGQSMRFIETLRLHQDAMQGEDIRGQLNKQDNMAFLNSYERRAKRLFEEGSDPDALWYYQKALEIAVKIYGENNLGVAPYYLKVGRSYYYLTNNQKALEFIGKALDNYKLARLPVVENNPVKPRGIGRAYMWLANVYYKQDLLKKAIDAHNMGERLRSLDVGDPAILKKQLVKVIAHRGNAYFKAGDYDLALREQKRALQLSIEVNGEVHKNTAWIYANLGVIYSKLGRREKSLQQFENISTIYERIYSEGHPVIYKNFLQLGQLYGDLENWPKAIENYDKALLVFQARYRDKYGLIAKCFAGLAEIYYHMGRLDLAIENINKAIEIEEVKNKDSVYVASHYFMKGKIYYQQGDFLNAIKCYRDKALSIFSKDSQWKDNELHHECLFAFMRALLAGAVNSKGKEERSLAQEWLAEAIKVANRLKDDSLEVLSEEEKTPDGLFTYDFIEYCRILSLLGQLYTLNSNASEAGEMFFAQALRWMKMPVLALRWAEQAINCFKLEPNRHLSMAKCYRLMADITLGQRRYHYSLIQFKKAIDLSPRADWELEYQSQKSRLSELLACVDDDLVIQLERAEETHYHLQERYLEDLSGPGEKKLSEFAKNRTTELLIKLRNILDMTYSRLIKEAIWQPNGHKIAFSYYPSEGSKKSLENDLIKSGVINLPTLSSRKLDVSSMKDFVTNLRRKLIDCGYIDSMSNQITEKAINEPDLQAVGVDFSHIIDDLKVEVKRLGKGEKLILGKIFSNQYLSDISVTSNEVLKWLIDVGVVKLILDGVYVISDKFISVAGDILLPPVAEPRLHRYALLIVKRLNEILLHAAQETASINVGPLRDCWELLLKEQTFTYYSEEVNKYGAKWSGAWLEKLNAIQNQSKHVRLTPQILKGGLVKKKAGVSFRRVKVNIEYLQSRFYSWTLIEPMKELTGHLTDVDKIMLSRRMLRFLKQHKYIDKQLVNHPLALTLVKLRKEAAANNEVFLAEEAFRSQLDGDIKAHEPAWSVYVGKLGDFLLLKLFQRAKLISVPDSQENAPWLLDTALAKVWQQVEAFGKARLKVSKLAKLVPAVSINLNEKLDFYKKSIAEIASDIANEEAKLKLTRLNPLNLQVLAEQHGILIRLNVLYGIVGKSNIAGELFLEAARGVVKNYPWLAVQYYSHAFKSCRNSLSSYSQLSYVARESAEHLRSQGLFVQARELIVKAQSYLIGNSKEYLVLQDILRNWAEEDTQRKAELDDEIDSQLRHANEIYAEAIYYAFNLYQNLDDEYLNQRLQNMLAEVVIKLRHLLDHAFTLFTQSCLYKNKTITMIQANFPFANSEVEFKEMIIDNIAEQEAGAYDRDNHPFFKLAPEYQDLYQAIVRLQPFPVGNKSWLEKIIKFGNQSKHVRVRVPGVDILQPLRAKAVILEDFYPSGISGEAIFPLLKESYEGVESLLKLMFKYINQAMSKKDKSLKLSGALGGVKGFSYAFFSKGALPGAFDREWYGDDEINLLLTHYLQQVNNVDILSAMQGTDWRGTNILRENLIQYNLQRLQKMASNELVADKVVIPVNLGGRHWVLLCIRYPDDQAQLPDVYYIDPLGLRPDYEVASALRNARVFSGVELIHSQGLTLQHDGYNCGPWIVEIARSFLNAGVIPEEGEVDIEAARGEHREQLAIIRAADIPGGALMSSLGQ
jgi:tetratricopeptide (TPR) repeat protein